MAAPLLETALGDRQYIVHDARSVKRLLLNYTSQPQKYVPWYQVTANVKRQIMLRIQVIKRQIYLPITSTFLDESISPKTTKNENTSTFTSMRGPVLTRSLFYDDNRIGKMKFI